MDYEDTFFWRNLVDSAYIAHKAEAPVLDRPWPLASGRGDMSPEISTNQSSLRLPMGERPLDKAGSSYIEADLVKVHRLIGALVLAIGLLVTMSGTVLAGVGTVGSARYRRASGMFIRAVSADDQRYFRHLSRSVATGRVFQGVGVVVCVGGLIVVARPAALTPIMILAKVEERSGSAEDRDGELV